MRRALLSFGFSLFAVSSFAQTPVTTGLPPFGSFDAGRFDGVNVQILNANFALPIISTPGRITGFNMSLVYDTLIWQNSGTAWTPVTDHVGNPMWGWKTITPLGDILYNHRISSVSKRCSIDVYDWLTTEIYNGYVYRDLAGTTHSFPTVYWKEVTDGCTGIVTDTSQLTGYAGDGSGMYINISNLDIPNVWTKSGILLNTNSEDTNGNLVSKVVVSSTETDWKDTAGLTAVRVIQNGSNTEYHYLDSAGTDRLFTLKRQLYSIKTAFACSGITDYNVSGTMAQVSLPYELDLPNGQAYLFSYEPTPNSSGFYTGRLKQVTLPAGGSVQYTYPTTPNNGISCADGTVVNLARTFSDGTNTATWNYVRNLSTLTTTVTTPQLPDTSSANDTVYAFNSNGQETSRKIYPNSPGTGTPLRTVNTTWAANGTPATHVTILEDGTTQSEVDTTYDSNGLLNSISEYNWGSGARGGLARTTTLTYQTATAYTSRQMLNLVTQKVVKDANNVTQFRQDVNYDESGYVNASCITGAAQHDDVGYGCSFATRGLPTSIIGYANAGAPSGSLTQHVSYDSLGNPISITDPAGNTTSISYTDNYSDGVNRSTYALPTTITQPVTNGISHIGRASYYYYFGLPYQTTDQNGQISTFSYDLMRRPGSVTDPTNAVVNFTYGATSAESVLNFNSGNSTADHLSTVDGLGRTQVQQARQAPNSTSFDSVETDYDLVGRVRRVTLPYSGTSGQTSSTAPATTTTFDALGRPLVVTDAGNGTVSYTYTKNDTYISVGPAPTGENTKRRQLEYDALGQLTSVCEVTGASQSGSCGQSSSATGYLTKYTYDALGNLTGVTQNSQPNGTTQTRSYSFDSLSRLTSETNAESGTTSYTYDSAAGCTGTYSGDLVKRVDAAGNTSCFTYDALHRNLSVTYPSGTYASVTPSKYFVYDAATVNSVSMANAKSRVAEAYTCFSPCSSKTTDIGFSYTVRGEVSDVYELTPHSSPSYYHVSQTYWPHGAPSQLGSNITGLPTISYGGTIGSTVGLDGEGRITQVTATGTGQQNPVTGVTYNNASLPTQVNFGSGDSDIFAYDSNTLRVTQVNFNVGTQSQSLTGNLTWNANSTLSNLAITDQFNSANTQTCKYGDPSASPPVIGYDDLVRLVSANCGTAAAQTFSYDPFGNISKSGSPYTFQPTYNAATNRFATIPGTTPSYDANGNVLTDGSHTYAWDADGNSVSLDGAGLTFDALDRMVEQNRSGTYTEIVYSPGGAKLALMSGTGGQTLQEAFVPLPGQATSIYTSSGLDHYRHSDWLGSARLTSSPSRAYVSSVAYAPYGEPYASSGTQDLSFTGEGQDTVSGDYDFLFREYSIQGRWPSPDPAGLAAAALTNPQSWNRYAYVLNNPISLIDPLGLHWECVTITIGGQSTTQCKWVDDPTTQNPPISDAPPSDFFCPPGWHLEIRIFQGVGGPACIPGHQLGDNVKEPRDRDNSSGGGGGVIAKVSDAVKALGSCTAQHFGLTAATVGTAALGAPVSKAGLGLRGGMQGASDTLSASSAIEWKLFGAAGPKIPGVNILGTSRVFGVIGRAAPYVSAALAMVDARLIGACMDQKLGYTPQGNGNQ